MNAYLWAALGAIPALGLCLVVLRRRQGLTEAAGRADAITALPERPTAAQRTAPGGAGAGFHAVTVKPCLEPCDAVQALAGKRFLSQEAPALPLENCDQARCNCTYRHFSDRRAPGDRRSGWDTFGAFSNTLANGERRDYDSDRRDQD
jgi:hypothetical protein